MGVFSVEFKVGSRAMSLPALRQESLQSTLSRILPQGPTVLKEDLSLVNKLLSLTLSPSRSLPLSLSLSLLSLPLPPFSLYSSPASGPMLSSLFFSESWSKAANAKRTACDSMAFSVGVFAASSVPATAKVISSLMELRSRCPFL